MIEKLAIIGNGRVAQYLGTAFEKKGMAVSRYARNPRREEEKTLEAYSAKEDLCLLCVSDQALAKVSQFLPSGDIIVAHVSGAMPLSSIDHRHPERAIFYPLMSISSSSEIVLEEIPFCLDASVPSTLERLGNFAEAQGLHWKVMNDADRAHLHLAAVLAQNFSQHLFQKAYEVMAKRGLDFQLLKALLQQMTANIDQGAPQEKQTGPAVRRDQETIDKHLALIEEPALKNLYQQLTKSIIRSDEKEL